MANVFDLTTNARASQISPCSTDDTLCVSHQRFRFFHSFSLFGAKRAETTGQVL
jgi:hypothetical protein